MAKKAAKQTEATDAANGQYFERQAAADLNFKSPFAMLNATAQDCQQQRIEIGMSDADLERDKATFNRVVDDQIKQHGYPDTNEKVDAVMLSHRDSDHSGGVKSVLTMHPKASFISSIESTHELQALRPAQRCEAGQSWIWDGVDFSVLHPSAADYDSQQKSNAMSCVLRISTPQASVLLAGDIELAQEARLVVAQKALNSTVLFPSLLPLNISYPTMFLIGFP